MVDLFEDPAARTGMDYQALKGSLLLVEVVGFEDHVPTAFTQPGQKNPAVRANVTIVDGPEQGVIYEDALVFPRALVAQLRSKVGRMVLGRLGQGEAKAGQNAPWKLAVATDSDKAKARAMMANSPAGTAPSSAEPPF